MISYHGGRPMRPRTRFNIAVSLPRRSVLSDCSNPAHRKIDSSSPHLVCTVPPFLDDPDTEFHLPPSIPSVLSPQYSPITPPASSQVALSPTAILPAPPSFPEIHEPPTTWDNLSSEIDSYISSTVTIPWVTHLNPALRDSFIEHVASAPRSSPLYNLRYTYEAASGLLIVRCMPAPEHDAIQGLFERGISSFSRTNALSDSERALFAIKAGTDVNAFGGSHQGSCKRADLSIVPQQPDDDLNENGDESEPVNGDFPSIAVEVGFSEDYDGLLADMDLWLRGSSGQVRVVVLVNLVETPQYNGAPFSRTEKPQTAVELPHGAEPPPRWVSQGTYGPILYDGHVLVGELSGFVELWHMDDTTSEPRMYSHRTVLPAPDVSGEDDCFVLAIADLFGGEERVPDRLDPAQEVRFEFAVYRSLLARAMREHGRQRLARAETKKRMRDGVDGTWLSEPRGGGKRRKA